MIRALIVRKIEYFNIVDLSILSVFLVFLLGSSDENDHRAMTEHDRIVIYGAALCAQIFFPEKY